MGTKGQRVPRKARMRKDMYGSRSTGQWIAMRGRHRASMPPLSLIFRFHALISVDGTAKEGLEKGQLIEATALIAPRLCVPWRGASRHRWVRPSRTYGGGACMGV